MLRLVRNVKGLGGLSLHAVGQFERLQARFELWVAGPGSAVLAVEFLQQIELAALVVRRCGSAPNVLDQLLDAGVFGVNVRSLIDAGQEPGLPVLRLLNWIPTRAKGDEARQVLIFGAEAVSQPRPKARADEPTNLFRGPR